MTSFRVLTQFLSTQIVKNDRQNNPDNTEQAEPLQNRELALWLIGFHDLFSQD
jgi:hypothetical protein